MVQHVSRVDVETRNRTAEELSEVVVWFGDSSCSSGYLVPKAQATYMYYPSPITKMARVEWKDAAGSPHAKEVDLSDIYQSGQSGLLQIAITEVGIEAHMLPLPTATR